MSQNDVESLNVRARGCLQKGDVDQAHQLFEQAIMLDANHVESIEGAAHCCFQLQEYDRAIECFERLTKLDPQEGRNWINLGAIHNRTGDHQAAIETLRKAIQKNNRSAEAYYNLGIAHRKLNQLHMAVPAYKEAIRLAPQMVEAHHNLGNAYCEQHNYAMAIAQFKKALEIQPTFERSQKSLAKAEQLAAESKKAQSPFGRLVDIGVQESHFKAAPVIENALNASQRWTDRREVSALADELHTLSQESARILKEGIEPRLLQLQRQIMSPDSSVSLMESTDALRQAYHAWTESRQKVRHSVNQLRAHEEMLNSPPLDASSFQITSPNMP